MVVQHNISAMNANRLFGINNSGLSKSLEKLSSGYAINRAGDNAAGLAVSEKMRAQISGLTQASKNAEDGISMVQTFEGALTETDSILQRMRTLAVQSANGTYQDDVDREAIQLEYDQLNDELNQIADTDFNGVVVLNGGQMADGLKQINGEFDYTNVTRLKKQLGSADIKTLDNKAWDADTANAAWDTWSNGSFDRTDADKTNDGPAETDITFKYSAADGTWSAISATNGMNVDAVNGQIDNSAKNGGTTTANNGGFALKDGTDEVANVVVDASKLQDGDTITLKFKNPLASKTAPENVAIKQDSIDTSNFTAGVDTTDATKTADATAVTVKTNNTISSTNNATTTFITEDQAKLYDLLDGATVKATYATGAIAANGFELTLKDGTSITSAANDAGAAFVVGNTTFYLGAEAVAAGGATGSVLTINTAADGSGTNLLTFTAAAGYDNAASAGNSDTSGSVSYTLSVAQGKFDESGLEASVVEPDVSQVSKSNSNDASTATLTYKESITLQTGARTKDSVNFTFKYESDGLGELKADLDCSARGLGTDKLSLSTQEDANAAIDKIDNAINKVSMVRASFGAMQNRLEHKIANLDVNTENLTAAESRIRDTDMASEMTNFTKNQILSQASQAMLAQANQLPQGVLQLLG